MPYISIYLPTYIPQEIPQVYSEKPERKMAAEQYKEQPTYKCKGELRDYQWEAVRWLVLNWSTGKGSILADEVGR